MEEYCQIISPYELLELRQRNILWDKVTSIPEGVPDFTLILGPGLNLDWYNSLAIQRVSQLSILFRRYPDMYDREAGGRAIWLKPKARNFKAYYETVEVRDDVFIHQKPVNHGDFLFVSIHMPLKADKIPNITKITDSVFYYERGGILHSTCGEMEASMATFAIIKEYNDSNISILEARERYNSYVKQILDEFFEVERYDDIWGFTMPFRDAIEKYIFSGQGGWRRLRERGDLLRNRDNLDGYDELLMCLKLKEDVSFSDVSNSVEMNIELPGDKVFSVPSGYSTSSTGTEVLSPSSSIDMGSKRNLVRSPSSPSRRRVDLNLDDDDTQTSTTLSSSTESFIEVDKPVSPLSALSSSQLRTPSSPIIYEVLDKPASVRSRQSSDMNNVPYELVNRPESLSTPFVAESGIELERLQTQNSQFSPEQRRPLSFEAIPGDNIQMQSFPGQNSSLSSRNSNLNTRQSLRARLPQISNSIPPALDPRLPQSSRQNILNAPEIRPLDVISTNTNDNPNVNAFFGAGVRPAVEFQTQAIPVVFQQQTDSHNLANVSPSTQSQSASSTASLLPVSPRSNRRQIRNPLNPGNSQNSRTSRNSGGIVTVNTSTPRSVSPSTLARRLNN